MGQLFFKKPLQDAIRDGRKRTTIRRWATPRVRAGQRAYAPGVGWLAIERVEPVDLNSLSDSDAVADGIENAHVLRAVLTGLYPDHETDGKAWFRVSFGVSELHAPRVRHARVAPDHPELW